jgi:hypothetical protein
MTVTRGQRGANRQERFAVSDSNYFFYFYQAQPARRRWAAIGLRRILPTHAAWRIALPILHFHHRGIGMRTLTWHVSALLLLHLLTSAAAAATRTVMLAGRVAWGTENARFAPGPNLRFKFNDVGHVAFVSNLLHSNGRVTDANDVGIWFERDEFGTRLVAREGDRPGSFPAGAKFTEWFDSLTLNNLDQVAFRGYAQAGVGGVEATDNDGVWIYRNANQQLVAREGQRPPGSSPDDEFREFTKVSLNDQGSLVYSGRAGDPATPLQEDRGFWRRSASGDQTLLSRDGSEAPGFPIGDTWHVTEYDFAFNDANQVAFAGAVANSTSNEHGLWLADGSGSATLVSRSGSAATGAASGTVFSYFQPPRFAGTNRLVSKARLQPGTGDATSANDTGLWQFGVGGGHSTLIAREGDPAPGFPDGTFFGSLDQFQLWTSDDGKTAFHADTFRLEGGKLIEAGHGTWQTDMDGNLRRQDFSQLSIPGLKVGETLRIGEAPLAMNRAGKFAFMGQLSRPGDDPWEGLAAFVQDLGGNLRLVARVGDVVDVDSGPALDLREIESLDFDESSFNNDGEFAFAAYFTDESSGIFVSDIGATLLGDYNDNGSVGPEDYTAWKAAFGTTNLAADGNGDGVVDAADYSVWRDNLGRSVAGGGGAESLAVPEPGIAPIACALVGAIGILVRCRRDTK